MNTCGTCKYFGPEPVWGSGYHPCQRFIHLNDCMRDEEPQQQAAGVIDGSGYFASLCVTDEFGCNQWEAK